MAADPQARDVYKRQFKAAAGIFQTIPGFKDADALAARCLEQAETARKNAIYKAAREKMAEGNISNYEACLLYTSRCV